MRDPLGYTIWKGPWNQKWVVLNLKSTDLQNVTITKIEALSGQEVIHTVICRFIVSFHLLNDIFWKLLVKPPEFL